MSELETFRCRIYSGTPFTEASVMDSARRPHGLTGESRRFGYPAAYYETHLVNEDWFAMSDELAPIVERLLARGLLERREVTRMVPAMTGFLGSPAHTSTSVTYHLTDLGRTEWLKRPR
jgi:hypothetical protein